MQLRSFWQILKHIQLLAITEQHLTPSYPSITFNRKLPTLLQMAQINLVEELLFMFLALRLYLM